MVEKVNGTIVGENMQILHCLYIITAINIYIFMTYSVKNRYWQKAPSQASQMAEKARGRCHTALVLLLTQNFVVQNSCEFMISYMNAAYYMKQDTFSFHF